MTNQETTEAFLKRIAYDYSEVGFSDMDRLLALARRGAKIPDEPSEAMALAGTEVFRPQAVEYSVSDGLRWQNCMNQAPRFIYRAMLATALKDTDNE